MQSIRSRYLSSYTKLQNKAPHKNEVCQTNGVERMSGISRVKFAFKLDQYDY